MMRRSTWFRISVTLACAALAFVAQRSLKSSVPPPENGPRLILLLVVDQLGSETFDRYEPLFKGGFRRLLERGAVFTQAQHAHANTVTGAGHATLATGLYPGHHGIVDNDWLDRSSGEMVYCVQDAQDKVSPRRLLGPTLGDWIKARGWPSKVYGLAGKDRSAVLLAGHHADGAYWYSKTGRFVSSSYYPERAPQWLAAFNRSGAAEAYFGQVWKPLDVDPQQLERLQIEEPPFGSMQSGFPHALGGPALAPDMDYYESLFTSPFLDEMLVSAAERLIEAEELGGDAYPDLLAISFSSPDAVGHNYGPDSREVLDILLRLDADLARLLDFVDAKVGLEHTVVALSSDHGVVPVPEVQQRRGKPGKRIGAAEVACFQKAAKAAAAGAARWYGEGLYLDRKILEDAGLDLAAVQRQVADRLEQCPSVARVYTASELERDHDTRDPVEALFVNGHHPDRSPDLEVQFQEFFLASRTYATSHGTPYGYDTHVPLMLYGPRVKPGHIERPVRTVDLASTLPALAGIQAPAAVDGVDLSDSLLAAAVAQTARP